MTELGRHVALRVSDPTVTLFAGATDSPWVSLWNQVSNAAWVAETGLPLGGTIAALGLAAFALRRQLGHDRELILQQRQAEAGRALGQVVAESSDALFAFMPIDPAWWHQDEWPDADGVLAALKAARRTLLHNREVNVYFALLNDISVVWRVCSKRREDLLAGREETELEAEAYAHALCTTLLNFWPIWNKAGEALLKWDGSPPMPKPEMGSLNHLSWLRIDHWLPWVTHYTDEMERHANDWIANKAD